jgi:hypothetical protein
MNVMTVQWDTYPYAMLAVFLPSDDPRTSWSFQDEKTSVDLTTTTYSYRTMAAQHLV